MTANIPGATRAGERRDWLRASHGELGDIYAAWAADVDHVEPGVRNSRFGARLAPFRSRDEAERALIEAGAVIQFEPAS